MNKAFIQYRKERSRELRESLETPPPTVPRAIREQSLSMISDLSNVSSTNSHMNIGRPVGSTEAKKREKKQELIEAKNEVATMYATILSERGSIA